MKIHGRWHYEDELSGLTFTVIEGERLDRLRVTFSGRGVDNRDFWFTKDGVFDGTGSAIRPEGRVDLDEAHEPGGETP